MTVETTRRILWLVLLVTLPVPYWVMEGGFVPTIWLFELGAFTLAVLWTEGGSIVALVTALFVVEALLAGAALYVLARIATRLLHGSLPSPVRTGGVVAIVAALFAAALAGVYRTPLVAGGARVNLLQLFA